MANLRHSKIFQMSSGGLNAGMEVYVPLINDIVSNALFHSSSHINHMPPKIIHILRFFLVDLLPQIL